VGCVRQGGVLGCQLPGGGGKEQPGGAGTLPAWHTRVRVGGFAAWVAALWPWVAAASARPQGMPTRLCHAHAGTHSHSGQHNHTQQLQPLAPTTHLWLCQGVPKVACHGAHTLCLFGLSAPTPNPFAEPLLVVVAASWWGLQVPAMLLWFGWCPLLLLPSLLLCHWHVLCGCGCVVHTCLVCHYPCKSPGWIANFFFKLE